MCHPVNKRDTSLNKVITFKQFHLCVTNGDLSAPLARSASPAMSADSRREAWVSLRGGREDFCQQPVVTLETTGHLLQRSIWVRGLFRGRGHIAMVTSTGMLGHLGGPCQAHRFLPDSAFQEFSTLFLHLPSGTCVPANTGVMRCSHHAAGAQLGERTSV